MKRVYKDVHIYFPPKVLAELKKLAKRNRRSVTSEVVIAVEKHIELDLLSDAGRLFLNTPVSAVGETL